MPTVLHTVPSFNPLSEELSPAVQAEMLAAFPEAEPTEAEDAAHYAYCVEQMEEIEAERAAADVRASRSREPMSAFALGLVEVARDADAARAASRLRFG